MLALFVCCFFLSFLTATRKAQRARCGRFDHSRHLIRLTLAVDRSMELITTNYDFVLILLNSSIAPPPTLEHNILLLLDYVLHAFYYHLLEGR